jgi:hypothetical protein
MDEPERKISEAAKALVGIKDEVENKASSKTRENLFLFLVFLLVASAFLANSYRTPRGYIPIGDWYISNEGDQYCGIIYDGWRGDIEARVMYAKGTGYGTIVSAGISRRFNFSGWRKSKYGFEVGKRRINFVSTQNLWGHEWSLAHDDDDIFAAETTKNDVLSFIVSLYDQKDITFYTYDDEAQKLQKHNYLTVSENGKRAAIDLFVSCVAKI